MRELDCEESWVPKYWCSWNMVLERTLKSPLDCKEIQPVHSEGDQPWLFFGRNDAKAETPVLWPPHDKSWLIGKDSDAGRDWGQEEKGTTEDEMAGWHHGLNGLESGWTPGVGDGQKSWRAVIHGVAKSWTRLSDWTELNWRGRIIQDLGNCILKHWQVIDWLSAGKLGSQICALKGYSHWYMGNFKDVIGIGRSSSTWIFCRMRRQVIKLWNKVFHWKVPNVNLVLCFFLDSE